MFNTGNRVLNATLGVHSFYITKTLEMWILRLRYFNKWNSRVLPTKASGGAKEFWSESNLPLAWQYSFKFHLRRLE